jgi:CRP-like cAMP-binding protein/predicted metal-dependent HD superfamily phosphohydrolase
MMRQPDFDSIQNTIRSRLENELPEWLVYHCKEHTLKDVLPAADRLAKLSGISKDDLLLLRTAILFHDIGFIESPQEHESIGARIAAQMLPGFGYSDEQIETILGIILATHLPQSPKNLLEQIIADADLDVIGREDFFERNQALRQELANLGQIFDDATWLSSQIEFLNQHNFFTQAARSLRNETKEKNVRQMYRLLEAATSNSMPANLLGLTERTAILRSVNLFAETPDSVLEEIALLLSPLEASAGENIFMKGEPGDCMYLIVRGRVRIHDGEMILNHLGAGDAFGEMAILDSQPRVASATAAEDTLLFKLDQEPFYELMGSRVEVARGVIRVLNRYLRGRVRERAADFEYFQQVGKITTAAAALETGLFRSETLDEVCTRQDELGQLARVFQKMAIEVQMREQKLKQELQQLRIQVDEARRTQAVAEITESEYFQMLESRIDEIRQRRKTRQTARRQTP